MITTLLLVLSMTVPCVRSTITETCDDDRWAWAAEERATFYHVEGWAFGPWEWGKLLDQDVITTSILVGCQPPNFFIYVWGGNANGLSPDAAVRGWEPGGGRILDSSNGPPDQWVGQLLCGVVL